MRTTATLLAAVTLLSPAARAQAPGARAVLADLPERLHVQIQFAGGTSATGLLALRGDTVNLYAPVDGWHRFGVDSVTGIARERGGMAVEGFRTGAIAGGFVGFLAGVAVAASLCGDRDSSTECSVSGVVGGGMILGAIGAVLLGVLGAILRVVIPTWDPIYPG
jgi:hypothetical protein